jgi:hypothetical protein
VIKLGSGYPAAIGMNREIGATAARKEKRNQQPVKKNNSSVGTW